MLRTLSFIAQHPLTRDRPLAGFARFAKWQIESRLRSEVEVDWLDGAKLLVRNGMTGATGNIYCGLHEFADMAFVLHLLKPGDLFVDVGANIGSYTVLASAVAGASAVAIEPDPGTMAFLRGNIELNQLSQQVEMIEAAVGAASGVARFTVGLDTTNRIATAEDDQTREVPVRTLDEVLQGRDPLLIKLDVEGLEAEVIAGAGRTLANGNLLAVETEGVSTDVVRPLLEAGFKRVFYNPFSRELSEQPAFEDSNALFVRNRPACDQRLKAATRRTICGKTF